MRSTALLLGAVCGMAVAAYAQRAATPAVELKASAVKLKTQLQSPWRGGAVCDGSGNVYMRLLGSEEAGSQERAAVPIQKITPEGLFAGSFQILKAFANEVSSKGVDVVGKGIFVTDDGRVFQTADVHGDTFVVEFSQDGSVAAKTKLLAPDLVGASTWRLAVFKSGEYLLTASTGKDGLTPFTGVFGADGKLMKKIYEPEDEEARQRTYPTDWDRHQAGSVGKDFIALSEVAAGSDGNLYAVHGTHSPALVYAISPAGDVVRKLRIDAKDPGMMVRSMRSYAGQLAVQFDGPDVGDKQQILFKVVDLKGNSIGDYVIQTRPEDGSLSLAGYGPEGFTFMPRSNKDGLYLVKAKMP